MKQIVLLYNLNLRKDILNDDAWLRAWKLCPIKTTHSRE